MNIIMQNIRRSGRIVTIALLAIVASMLLSSCAGRQSVAQSNAYLEKATGLTVTVLDRVIVFYREDTRIAANARDYLYMGPVEINRSGKHMYYLWLGNWSTIDRVAGQLKSDPARQQVFVVIDGQPLELLDRVGLSEIGIDMQPYRLPSTADSSVYFRVSRDQIRSLAKAATVVIQVGEAERSFRYRIWQGDVADLTDFSEYDLMSNRR
jgi:hypothetical protein